MNFAKNIEKLEIAGLSERYKEYIKIRRVGAVALFLLMVNGTAIVCTVTFFPKYFDFVFYAGITAFGVTLAYYYILSNKTEKLPERWYLISTKAELYYSSLPLTAGIFLMALFTYYAIAQIAGWGFATYFLFIAIFSIPLIFVILQIFFLQDSYKLRIDFLNTPENIIEYFEKMPNCKIKKSFWLGFWSGNCKNTHIKIVPISTYKTKKTRIIIENIKDGKLKDVKEIISLLGEFKYSNL